MIHFIAQHLYRILAVWFVLSVTMLFLWSAFFGETEEQRDARKRREAAARARDRLKEAIALYNRRLAMKSVPEVPESPTQIAAREAEGAQDFWTEAADGRHVA